MKHLAFLLPLLFSGLSYGQSGKSQPEKPLNVVILFADDWRHDTLGSAGNAIVKTPHLDELASKGMQFTHNCVTTSICGVSRASLFTGQWMSRHGCRGFKEWKTPFEESFPALLRENDYHVGHVGKWHNGKFPAEKFDFGRSYSGHHWYELPDGRNIHVTKRNEEDALAFLSTRPEKKPFCLTVAFFATHAEDHNPDQFRPQPESMAWYQDVTIPVPKTATQESWENLPDFFNDKNEGRNRWRWRFDTPEKFQRMMKNYYRLATEVDATCGRIIAELESQGVLDETLVIFTTDNGYYHAEHGLADKWYPHQESIRVPLIIHDPRMDTSRHGSKNDDFTLNIDLAPTILSATGIEVPEKMQGQDLSPFYLADEPPSWRTEFFYEHPTLRNASFIPASEALVRKDYKYFYWPEADFEQLFHLETDPHEEKDLAKDKEHAEVLTAMRERFRKLKAAAR